jgi:hypothetical protein
MYLGVGLGGTEICKQFLVNSSVSDLNVFFWACIRIRTVTFFTDPDPTVNKQKKLNWTSRVFGRRYGEIQTIFIVG